MRSSILILALLCIAHWEINAQGNRKPKITGQEPLTTPEDQSITILMRYLDVEDPDDWFYPWGFTMKLYPGDNYAFEGQVVTPAPDFNGKLVVGVTVHDGEDESKEFGLEITVTSVNDKPVITGHAALTTNEGQALTIIAEHLKATDPDNKYPDDFTLRLYNGSNYTLNGNQVTPNAGFTGTLYVNVTVNDGSIDSDAYALPVAVKAVNRVPQITGQANLQVDEDKSITILLSHLSVTDDDDNYPNGFSLIIDTGQNYAFSGSIITPAKDFYGRLTVPVGVNDGKNTSKPFNLLITVTPVNDIPVIADIETEPVHYNPADIYVALSQTLVIREVDGDSIMFAEVGVHPDTYQVNVDKLVYNAASGDKIRGVFDPNTGILTLLGQASPQRYAAAIRSVQYQCLAPSRDINKTIFISVNDGKGHSEEVERQVLFGQVSVSLDIPTGFTPNGDLANDTWKIIPLKEEEEYAQARIRVYNKEGAIVYESTGFENEWDGRHNGQLLPAGTYFYTIDLNINAPEGYLKGLVTILR